MMHASRPRLAMLRPPVTRPVRKDGGGSVLETLAAEFALLAQRRARIARQVDLLDRQLNAAAAGLEAVQARMGTLAQRMDVIDPSLRAENDLPAPPPPPSPPPKHLGTTAATKTMRPMRLPPRRRPGGLK